ncbi:MAG: carboxylesterase family protein [Pseudomonadota bacterium]
MATTTTTVETSSGPVVGRSKNHCLLFAGVPYAQPPLENLRFKPPVPHTPWVEPQEALKFGPAAPQIATGGMTDAVPVRWDEDCLTLNISTPGCDAAGRAVLVWIHGGGYRTGQGSIPWYNGASFCQNGDIVVVSINYRLGALGFTDLSHLGEEYANSALLGTLDQIAALRWVEDNITAFGGDPAKVTIAGESAGGFSVATLIGCRSAQGLFHRAIPQSGAAQHTLPKAASARVTEVFLERLGIDDAIGLASVSVDEILRAQAETCAYFEGGAGLNNQLGVPVSAFYPAHETPLLPESPLDAIKAGVGREVAVLTGSNSDETTLWGYGRVDEDKLERIAAGLHAERLVEVYQKTRATDDPETLAIAMTTDHMFRIPAIRLAEARLGHTDQTWLYQFDWASRVEKLKATHALEIPFAFDNLHQPGVDAFIGPGDKPQHVAEAMHTAWIDFINMGDPGWATYETDARTTMMFADASAAVRDPAPVERQAWEGIR